MAKNVLDLEIRANELIDANNPPLSLVNKIREWVDDQINLPRTLTEAQIVTFLYACNFDEKRTFKCIEEYYKCRNSMTEFFTKQDINYPELQQVLKVNNFGLGSVETDDGYCIIFHKLLDHPAHLFQLESFLKLMALLADLAIYKKVRRGAIFVCDIGNVRFGHLTRARLGLLRKFNHYMQNAIPLHMCGLHFINPGLLMDNMLFILKKIMSNDAIDMIHVHRVGNNYINSLHKFIPPKCLPSDYGGNLPSIAEMHMDLYQDLQKLIPYLQAEERQRNEILK